MPSHVELYACVDILKPEEISMESGVATFVGYSFHLQSPLQLSSKGEAKEN